MQQQRLLPLLLAGVATLAAPAASAETLRDALTRAYQTNPALAGERAGLRATDENVPIARAAGLPSASINGTYTENALVPSSNTLAQPARQALATANLSVPVYAGGAVRNGVRAAEQRVLAGRATLRSAEANLFTNVVAAYNNVIRDEAIVQLNQQNVRVLQVNVQATSDRFEVGDLTRTDVAQSQARLAIAEGQLRSAEAQLIASRENYIALVGSPAGALEAPPALPNLPGDPNSAVTVALENNPALEAARRQIDASRADVGVARASRLPRVNAVAGLNYNNFLGSLGSGTGLRVQQDGTAGTLGLQLQLPVFQGGRPAAQVRQAQALEGRAMEQATNVERGVVSDARSTYAAYVSAQQVIRASEAAVSANRLSLEGVRTENSVGTRTIIEVLNAEQELLNAQVQLVSARRDAYVAGFALLAAMGRAEARDLGLDGGALYDPIANYDRVRGRIFDFDSDEDPTPQGTRTVETPAQTPAATKPLAPELQRGVDNTPLTPNR